MILSQENETSEEEEAETEESQPIEDPPISPLDRAIESGNIQDVLNVLDNLSIWNLQLKIWYFSTRVGSVFKHE